MRPRIGVTRTGINELSAIDRQVKAVELRSAGKTYQQIAVALGYASPSGARKAVITALTRTLQEPADALRALENARLDAMFVALWPKAMDGSPRHVDAVLKIMDRRAALLGLNAPVKTDNRHTVLLVAEQLANEAGNGITAMEIIAEADRIIRLMEGEDAA